MSWANWIKRPNRRQNRQLFCLSFWSSLVWNETEWSAQCVSPMFSLEWPSVASQSRARICPAFCHSENFCHHFHICCTKRWWCWAACSLVTLPFVNVTFIVEVSSNLSVRETLSCQFHILCKKENDVVPERQKEENPEMEELSWIFNRESEMRKDSRKNFLGDNDILGFMPSLRVGDFNTNVQCSRSKSWRIHSLQGWIYFVDTFCENKKAILPDSCSCRDCVMMSRSLAFQCIRVSKEGSS